MKIVCIYKITSPSGKVYIGQTVDYAARMRSYKGGFCKNQLKLVASIKKYGWKKHKMEILHRCNTDELNALELYYIELFQSCLSDNGMNLKHGGGSNSKHSEETKAKMSLAAKGRVFSDQHRENLSRANSGKPTHFKGKNHTEQTREKMRGRVWSEADRKRMSEAMMGRLYPCRNKPKLSLESRQRISEAAKLNSYENNVRSKLIVNVETGIFYSGAREVSELFGIDRSLLTMYLNGRIKKNKTSFIYA